MAVITGKDAYFKMKAGEASAATAVSYINNFSLTINSASVDISSLGTIWKEFQGDLKDWSVSASGILDMNDTAQAALYAMLFGSGTVSEVELHMGAGTVKEYVGNAVLTSISESASVGSAVSVSYNFQGTGALEMKEITA